MDFSRNGKLVVAADRRDDPIKQEDGIVAIYEAGSGRTVHEVPQKEIRWAALAPGGRMVVVATSGGGWNDTRLLGIEAETGRTRWTNPPVDQQVGFVQLAGMQFRRNAPWLEVALRDGSVIRLNGLTGHEQRRLLADWRTPEQKAGTPRFPDMWEARFSSDGRTLVSSHAEWVAALALLRGLIRGVDRDPVRSNGIGHTTIPLVFVVRSHLPAVWGRAGRGPGLRTVKRPGRGDRAFTSSGDR